MQTMQQRVPRDKNRIQESTLRTINPILTTINPILTNNPFNLLPFYPFFFFFLFFFLSFQGKRRRHTKVRIYVEHVNLRFV